MDTSVGSTIEKIKLHEQDIENKLKEKREHEAVLKALSRSIKEAELQVTKSDQEHLEISERIEKLRPLLEIEKIKRVALLAQLQSYTKLFEDLKIQSNQGINKVWSLRSSLCKTVQSVSDVCDVWALLRRPVRVNSLPQPQPKVIMDSKDDPKLSNNESRLKASLKRRKDLEGKREKLLAAPDTEDEFIRQNKERIALFPTTGSVSTKLKCSKEIKKNSL